MQYQKIDLENYSKLIDTFNKIIEAKGIDLCLRWIDDIADHAANEKKQSHRWFFDITQKKALEEMREKTHNKTNQFAEDLLSKSTNVSDQYTFFECAATGLVLNSTDTQLKVLLERLMVLEDKYVETLIIAARSHDRQDKLAVIKNTIEKTPLIPPYLGYLITVLSRDEITKALQDLNSVHQTRTIKKFLQDVAIWDDMLVPQANAEAIFQFLDSKSKNNSINKAFFFNDGFLSVISLIFGFMSDDQRCEILNHSHCILTEKQFESILANNQGLSLRCLNELTQSRYRNNTIKNPKRSDAMIAQLCNAYDANVWDQPEREFFCDVLADPVAHVERLSREINTPEVCLALIEQFNLVESTKKMFFIESINEAVHRIIGSDKKIKEYQYKNLRCFNKVPEEQHTIIDQVWPKIFKKISQGQANQLLQILMNDGSLDRVLVSIGGELIEKASYEQSIKLLDRFLLHKQYQQLLELFSGCRDAGSNIPDEVAKKIVAVLIDEARDNTFLRMTCYPHAECLPLIAIFKLISEQQQIKFITNSDIAIKQEFAEILFPANSPVPVELKEQFVKCFFLKAANQENQHYAKLVVSYLLAQFALDQKKPSFFEAIFSIYINDQKLGAKCFERVFTSEVFPECVPRLLETMNGEQISKILIAASKQIPTFDVYNVVDRLVAFTEKHKTKNASVATETLMLLFQSADVILDLVEKRHFNQLFSVYNSNPIHVVKKIVQFLIAHSYEHQLLINMLRTAMGICVNETGSESLVTHRNIREDIVDFILTNEELSDNYRNAIRTQQHLLFQDLVEQTPEINLPILQSLLDFGCRPAVNNMQDEDNVVNIVCRLGSKNTFDTLTSYLPSIPAMLLAKTASCNPSLFQTVCAHNIQQEKDYFNTHDLTCCYDSIIYRTSNNSVSVEQDVANFIYLVKHLVVPTLKHVQYFMENTDPAYEKEKRNLSPLLDRYMPNIALQYAASVKNSAKITNLLSSRSKNTDAISAKTWRALTPLVDDIQKHSAHVVEKIQFNAPPLHDYSNEHKNAIAEMEERSRQLNKRKVKAIILGLLLLPTIVGSIVVLAWYLKTREKIYSLKLKKSEFLAYKLRTEKQRSLYSLERRAQIKDIYHEKKCQDGDTVREKRKLIKQNSSNHQLIFFFENKKQKDKFLFKYRQWTEKNNHKPNGN